MAFRVNRRPSEIEGTTCRIPLTKGFAALVDLLDADLGNRHWYASGPAGRRPYAARREGRRGPLLYLHRVVAARFLTLAGTLEVDHINGDSLDCRRSNLRLATRTQNMRNIRRSSSNRSGLKGVGLHKASGLWRARVCAEGREMVVYRRSQIAAYVAYTIMAKRFYGDFARLK